MTNAASTDTQTLDAILDLQFRVAWAGEGRCEPPRLSWWRTNLVDPEGGGDFMQRLARRTHAWASLEAVREAARRADALARDSLADRDKVRTLYSWGFDLDELLADRLRERKWSQLPAPDQGLFDRIQLEGEFKSLAPGATYHVQASGRQMRGLLPQDVVQAARWLVSALTPFSDAYPMPFFRIP